MDEHQSRGAGVGALEPLRDLDPLTFVSVNAADHEDRSLGVRSPVCDGSDRASVGGAADELDRGSGSVAAYERKCGEEGVEHFAQPTFAGG